MAELVVPGPFIFIREHLVRLVDFLKLCLRLFVPRVEVRVVLFRQFAVGFFNFVFGGVLRHTHHFIKIPFIGHTNHSYKSASQPGTSPTAAPALRQLSISARHCRVLYPIRFFACCKSFYKKSRCAILRAKAVAGTSRTHNSLHLTQSSVPLHNAPFFICYCCCRLRPCTRHHKPGCRLHPAPVRLHRPPAGRPAGQLPYTASRIPHTAPSAALPSGS